MNKNVDVLALILVLAGFACISVVQQSMAQCSRTTAANRTARLAQAPLVDLRLPNLCLTRQ